MQSITEYLTQDAVKQFIAEQKYSDPNTLLLNPPKEFKNHIGSIVDQIIARRKASGKLKDWSENFNLIMPPPLSIEQASSDSTGDYKKSLIQGDTLVDLTGGMGIDCLSLSEKFSRTIYVEQNELLCDVFRHNSLALKKELEIRNEQAETFLASSLDSLPNSPTFFIDPARRDNNNSRVFRIQDCSPDLLDMLPIMKEKAAQVLVKYSPLLDIKSLIHTIPGLKEIHVVSVKNDCKELLLLIEPTHTEEPNIICVNLETEQPSYNFRLSEERISESLLEDVKDYIFEPNASILKAGAFGKIAEGFQLGKLGDHTHFYTSEKTRNSFPGRTFQVLEVATKKSIKHFAPDGKLNVITRNYPQSATELKKKWKLKDGGDNFLLAYRDKENKAKMQLAKRVS